VIGESIDPGTKLGRLSLGQRQMVEIAKALNARRPDHRL
jgi:ABC-type sugar transport system ATPase subunit